MRGHKVLGVLLAIVVLISMIPNQVYAQEENYIDNTERNNKYFYEGPSVEFDLSKENNYTDKIKTRGISGVTTITCSLSGRTGGIDGLYEIIIHWQGNNRVNSISASKLYINNGNILSPKTYRTSGFGIDCKSKYSGYRVIGTCYIPKEVKSVRVSSKLLQAYFNDRDYWIRLNELYGTINL